MTAQRLCLNHLISPLYLNEILVGVRFGSFIILRTFYHALLPWRLSIKRSLLSLWLSICIIFMYFLLLHLMLFFLFFFCLYFQYWIKVFVVGCFIGFILFGTFWCVGTQGVISFPHLMEVLNFHLFKNFFKPLPPFSFWCFLLVFSMWIFSWDGICYCPRILRAFHVFLFLFLFFFFTPPMYFVYFLLSTST